MANFNFRYESGKLIYVDCNGNQAQLYPGDAVEYVHFILGEEDGSPTLTADKTFAQIKTIVESGSMVYATYELEDSTLFAPVTHLKENEVEFIVVTEKLDELDVYFLVISVSDNVESAGLYIDRYDLSTLYISE